MSFHAHHVRAATRLFDKAMDATAVWRAEAATLIAQVYAALVSADAARVEIRFDEEGRPEARDPASGAVWERPGRKTASDTRATLIVPLSDALRRTATLPAASRSQLREIVSHQIERWTPFAKNDLYWDCVQTGADPVAKTIEATLYAAPRAVVSERLTAAQAYGAPVDRVAPEDAPDRINLLPAGERPARPRGSMRTRILFRTALALLAWAFALTFVGGGAKLIWLSAQTARLEATASETIALTRRADAAEARALFVAREKAQSLALLPLLDELAAALPKDAWLEQLSVKDGAASLSGVARNAAEVLAALGAMERLADPQFTSAVVRNPSNGTERFSIEARLVAGSAEEVGR